MSVFTSLREANITRQAEWDTGCNIDLSYSGNELAGEAGELIEAARAIMDGGDDYVALAQEVADTIICCDLIAMRLDMPLTIDGRDILIRDTYTDDLIGQQAASGAMIALAIEVGRVSNTIKKRERERFGMVGARGSLTDLQHNLCETVLWATALAAEFGVTASAAVADKFNLTSRKYGLSTMMEA